MVKVIGVTPNGHLVVLRLENGTIVRVREDSFELEHIPDRPRERKQIDYKDLLLANDFIAVTHKFLQIPRFDLVSADHEKISDVVKLLINRIYDFPGPLTPPPKPIKKEAESP